METLDAFINSFNTEEDTEQISYDEVSAFMNNREEKTVEIIDKFEEVLRIMQLRFNYHLSSNDASIMLDPFSGTLTEWFTSGLNSLAHISMRTQLKEVAQRAIRTFFNLLPLQVHTENKTKIFPLKELGDVMRIIVLNPGDIKHLLEVVEEFCKYEDIRLAIWKGLEIACIRVRPFALAQFKNVLDIINLIGKLEPSNEIGPKNFLCQVQEGLIGYKGMTQGTLILWKLLSSVTVSPSLKQTLLVALLEHIMPRMKSPIFLTDYFMNTLDEGGALSLLALQGMFTLIQKCNITYPDVYPKLYSLLQPEIFSAPYKSRFYYLTDIFLSSTHIPEAMAAGFAKKFARLSLQAPPVDICILLSMICNLLIRHKGLKKLVNNIDGDPVQADSYDITEPKPDLSKALESSLWEVKLLQNHVLPSVSSAAMFINNPLPAVEIDLGPLLDAEFSQVFHKEYKKKIIRSPPLCFEKPTSLFVPRLETGLSFWSLIENK